MHFFQKNNILLDKIGMWISGACAIHCSVLPLLVVFGLGSGMGWMLSHEVELIFLISSLCIASFSLAQGYLKVHRDIRIILLACVGFISFIVGHQFQSLLLHISFSTLGGILILLAHLANFKLRHRSRNLATK